PVDQVIDHDATAHLGDNSHHVLVRPTALGDGLRRDRRIVITCDPAGEIDVMRREILDDTDIGDAMREWTLTPRLDLIELAKVARGESGLEALQRRVVTLDVPDSGNQA